MAIKSPSSHYPIHSFICTFTEQLTACLADPCATQPQISASTQISSGQKDTGKSVTTMRILSPRTGRCGSIVWAPVRSSGRTVRRMFFVVSGLPAHFSNISSNYSFVPDYLFKGVCIASSLGGQKWLFLLGRGQVCLQSILNNVSSLSLASRLRCTPTARTASTWTPPHCRA